MGMDAYVLCIGEFSEEIKDCLLYDAEFYEDTKPGTTVIAHKLHCSTSDQSSRLAEVLGCEVWDFNTHRITDGRINWPDIYKMMEVYADWDGEWEVIKFNKLLEAGFMCIYMPNG